MNALRTQQPPRLSALLDHIAPVADADDCAVSGLAMDSRAVVSGGVFLACRGTRHHGLEFVERALKRGAQAVVWEREQTQPPKLPAAVTSVGVTGLSAHVSTMAGRFYGNPSQSLTVAAVTGTNGKSSVTHLMAQALMRSGVAAASLGTLGAQAGHHQQTTGMTTPDPVSLQRLLAEFCDQQMTTVVMEASSHGLAQYRLDGVDVNVAVLTNLTRDHLDYHASLEAYQAAKARLFTWPGLKAAVVNLDDSFSQQLIQNMAEEVMVIGYSLQDACPVDARVAMVLHASDITPHPQGVSFTVEVAHQCTSVNCRMIGQFNVANILAAMGALHALGEPLEKAVTLFNDATGAPGRMQVFGGHNKPGVVVDFAHTPDALEKALAAAREHAHGRVLLVFGCGGDRDGGKRPLMARVAEAGADVIWVSDDNPRTEDGAQIVQQVIAGFSAPDIAIIERDRRRAINAAIRTARPGDVVLVAGKGHETTQTYGMQHRPFDDRDVVSAALEAY